MNRRHIEICRGFKSNAQRSACVKDAVYGWALVTRLKALDGEVAMNSWLKRMLTLKFRKQRRYKAKDGVYVAYEMSLSKNQIDNISMGGLGFYYVDDGTRIDKGSYQLAVFAKKHLYWGEIPFKTVSDVETGELIFKDKTIKRQSVRFEHLSSSQKNHLRELLKSHVVR